ncbi:MAG: MarC family protein [Muribaculaceae bacterium]|nr:MarC family protein [Muribaculaceae bacterium]
MFDDKTLPFLFICLTSFFSLTNPLGTMPVFLSMTKEMDNNQRKAILKRAVMIAIVILLGFTFCGQVIFTVFGISTNGFRIAAGVIIMKIGFDMLNAQYTSAKMSAEEEQAYARNITVTPLAIPMLCGPGAIANGIMLMDQATNWLMMGIVVGSILFIYALGYIILRASTRLVSILGETGNNVMMRLMGLILMVIAVECFVGGIKPILIGIIKAGNGL